MADYYAILKRAVSAVPDADRERRQVIYDKARKALLTKLQNMDPPLVPADISKQRMALEEAVRAVERDLALEENMTEEVSKALEDIGADLSEEGASGTLEADRPEPSEARSDGSAGAEDAGPRSPETKLTEEAEQASVPKSAAADTATLSSSSAKETGDQDQSKPVLTDPEQTAPSDKIVRRAGRDVLKNAVRDANNLGAATNAAVKSAQEAGEAVGEKREGDVARIEPTLGDAVLSDQKVYHHPGLGAKPTDEAPETNPWSEMLDKDEPSKGRFGLWAMVALGVVVLGGAGLYFFHFRDQFIGPVADVSVKQQAVSGPAGPVDQERPETDAGNGAGEEEVLPAKPVRTVTVTQPEPAEPPIVEDDTGSGDGEGVVQAPPASDEAPVASDEQSDNLVAEETAPVVDAPSEAADGVGAPTGAEEEVASDASTPQQPRSILYEEAGPKGEPGSATAGQSIWRLEGAGDDAVVEIAAEIPEQQLSFLIRISKNSDADLPASHLIEIATSRAASDPDKAIANIPGLILKPTEQSRGEGLVGAAIRISDDLHWIALTAGAREIRYNLELMMLRSWIDIPIQYSTGRRAILTLEKGRPGEQVIEDAIKAWTGN